MDKIKSTQEQKKPINLKSNTCNMLENNNIIIIKKIHRDYANTVPDQSVCVTNR